MHIISILLFKFLLFIRKMLKNSEKRLLQSPRTQSDIFNLLVLSATTVQKSQIYLIYCQRKPTKPANIHI